MPGAYVTTWGRGPARSKQNARRLLGGGSHLTNGQTTMYSRRMEPTDFLPLSPRDFLVLLVLVDGPLHGWGILKAVEERVGDGVSMDPANLYRSMRRLKRDGIVAEVRQGGADTPADQRRNFDLTELGRAVVRAEAARLAHLTAVAQAAKLLG